MKKSEKINALNAPAVAYYSGFGGLEVKQIEYDINDYIIFIAGAWNGRRTAHRARIYYTLTGRAFFRYNDARIPLDECIRTGGGV